MVVVSLSRNRDKVLKGFLLRPRLPPVALGSPPPPPPRSPRSPRLALPAASLLSLGGVGWLLSVRLVGVTLGCFWFSSKLETLVSLAQALQLANRVNSVLSKSHIPSSSVCARSPLTHPAVEGFGTKVS